jgi:hypothetical protein
MGDDMGSPVLFAEVLQDALTRGCPCLQCVSGDVACFTPSAEVRETDYFKPAVTRGAAFLDGIRQDWRPQIDVRTLRLESGTECVLGQLYGTYSQGLVETGLSVGVQRPSDYGFSLRGDIYYYMPAWYALNRAWREELSRPC